MALTVDAAIRLGTLDLRAELCVGRGELVALLGPNGAGKSTLLRAVAGLQPLDAGELRVGDLVLDRPDTATFVPPERRPIGVVFQHYLLFEHLTVLENVAFGLRARRTPKREARRRAAELLDRLALGPLSGSRPRQLSGGQQQRVALARALAARPEVLLLDEPLAALDAGTRNEVRRELRRTLQGFEGVRLLVTHDPVDAHALADRVVVLEAGRVVQQGTLAEVTAHPRSRYVAELVGVNLLAGELHGGLLRTGAGAQIVSADHAVPDGPALAALRPQSIALHRDKPLGSPRNTWELTVAELDRHADRVRVRLDGPLTIAAEITPAALAELDLRPGETVWASLKATDVAVYPR